MMILPIRSARKVLVAEAVQDVVGYLGGVGVGQAEHPVGGTDDHHFTARRPRRGAGEHDAVAVANSRHGARAAAVDAFDDELQVALVVCCRDRLRALADAEVARLRVRNDACVSWKDRPRQLRVGSCDRQPFVVECQ